MRRLVLLGIGAGLAVSMLPLTAASAYCDVVVDGHCANACTLVLGPYGAVREATGYRLLPNVECPQ